MAQIEKNNVSAENQLNELVHIEEINGGGAGRRVLFVGNSITMHGYKPDIGWYGVNYGMAASCKEKDYVHRVLEGLGKKEPDVVACVCQAAHWEREYTRLDEVPEEHYGRARDFAADVIVLRIVENCDWKQHDSAVFRRKLKRFLDYLNKTGEAKIIVTTGFWKHPGDADLRAVAAERGYPLVELNDLGEMDEMKAIGLFAHEGVANHPGDKGMEEIAQRILSCIQELGGEA